MDALPHDFVALSALVFVLGLKHGLDADHLATIDGLTRFNMRANRRIARWCGALFSLGHGAVVVAIAVVVAGLARHWRAPEWLELSGIWISIFFLVLLGLLNLRAVLRTDPAEVVQPVAVKGRLLGPLTAAATPGLVMLIGALFALSFDTISQATLFALTATQFGGWQPALLLGGLFMVGMLVTDGINGFWISRLIGRADRIALVASRVMGLVVAGASLAVAAFGIAKLSFPAIAAWSDGKDMFFGSALIVLVATSFAVAVRLAKPQAMAAGME